MKLWEAVSEILFHIIVPRAGPKFKEDYHLLSTFQGSCGDPFGKSCRAKVQLNPSSRDGELNQNPVTIHHIRVAMFSVWLLYIEIYLFLRYIRIHQVFLAEHMIFDIWHNYIIFTFRTDWDVSVEQMEDNHKLSIYVVAPWSEQILARLYIWLLFVVFLVANICKIICGTFLPHLGLSLLWAPTSHLLRKMGEACGMPA